jgi:hypothetical protein
LTLLATAAGVTNEAAAVDVGLEAVLESVVAGGRQASGLSVAISTDAVLAIAVDDACAAIGAGKTAGSTTIGVTLCAVLDLIETRRRLAFLAELVTDEAQAVRAHPTRGPVGASATVAAAV